MIFPSPQLLAAWTGGQAGGLPARGRGQTDEAGGDTAQLEDVGAVHLPGRQTQSDPPAGVL